MDQAGRETIDHTHPRNDHGYQVNRDNKHSLQHLPRHPRAIPAIVMSPQKPQNKHTALTTKRRLGLPRRSSAVTPLRKIPKERLAASAPTTNSPRAPLAPPAPRPPKPLLPKDYPKDFKFNERFTKEDLTRMRERAARDGSVEDAIQRMQIRFEEEREKNKTILIKHPLKLPHAKFTKPKQKIDRWARFR